MNMCRALFLFVRALLVQSVPGIMAHQASGREDQRIWPRMKRIKRMKKETRTIYRKSWQEVTIPAARFLYYLLYPLYPCDPQPNLPGLDLPLLPGNSLLPTSRRFLRRLLLVSVRRGRLRASVFE